jgi:hypothetical protein
MLAIYMKDLKVAEMSVHTAIISLECNRKIVVTNYKWKEIEKIKSMIIIKSAISNKQTNSWLCVWLQAEHLNHFYRGTFIAEIKIH